MSDFKIFKTAVQKKFDELAKSEKLFITNVEKDLIWDTYLSSYPDGTNNIYRKRAEHDCSSCRQFIRPFGNVVAIVDNKLISIWDVEVPYPYNVVAEKLSKLVKSVSIKEVFVTKFANCGVDHNHESLEDGTITTWEHFSFRLPNKFVDTSADSVEAVQGTLRDTRNVFQRSLKEISIESVETTLELIAQNSLYRGSEFKGALENFLKYQKEYLTIHLEDRDNYCWNTFSKVGPAISKIRNSAIGTLLTDISEGRELDAAVTAFEKIMAPSNYKRPTALLTKAMIEQAQKKIQELGLENSLARRYAHIEDITVNNVIFANRNSKSKMNASVFDSLKEDVAVNPKTFNKVEEVSIEDFVTKVVPTVSNIEIMMDNRHSGNLMSLIAPQDREAASILKWDNNFCWSYNGEVADSDLRQAVQNRGGRIDGAFRFSHSWNHPGNRNQSLMDLHVFMPGCEIPKQRHHGPHVTGRRVGWNCRTDAQSGGTQDVDYTNAAPVDYIPVENITFPRLDKMPEGVYTCAINNWSFRSTGGKGRAEIEFGGELYQYEYPATKQDEWVIIAEVTLKSGIFTIKHVLPLGNSVSKDLWGVKTNRFQKVSMLMFSPNHWDEQGVGNKHYFFMLEGCKNPGTPRGFYNEFLKEDLMAQKRVFEALGDKMKVEPEDTQLSGVGFSSTQRNSIIAKVEGSVSRVVKINF